MRNNGETNPGTYVVGVIVAAVGFYTYHVAPVYWDNLEAKEAAAEAFNVYILNGEQAARQTLMTRLNDRNPDVSHYEMSEEGVESVKPGYGILDDDVTIDLDERDQTLTVRIVYERIVEFAPLKKRKRYHLVAEKIGKLSR